MKKIIATIVALTACTETETQTKYVVITPECVSAVVELCGEKPLYPGHTLSYESGNVIIAGETWSKIESWQRDIELWSQCATEVTQEQ